MKRTSQDCAGRPVSEKARLDVVVARGPRLLVEVASFLDARGEKRDSDAAIVNEFAEFLSGFTDPNEPPLPSADPVFKERLRRRLWRMHLFSQPMDRGEPH